MLEKLSEIICNYVEVDPANITVDSRFMEDLGFTSFDFMSLLGELEDEFDVEIPDKKLRSLVTINDVIALIESQK